MNPCPALPATGASITPLVLAALALVAFGALVLVAVRWRRHAALPVVVGLAIGLAVLAQAGHTTAAPPCAPTTIAAPATSTSPDSSTTTPLPPSSTTTSSTSSTSLGTTSTSSSTSTTSTTSTVPGVAPIVQPDIHTSTTSGAAAGVGQPYSLNVLANDFLGDPPATIFDHTFAPVGPCTGFSFDVQTGVFSGTPTILGFCSFNYVLANVAGINGEAVVVEVAELRAPNAIGASEQVTAGQPFSFALFRFGSRGVPQATITAHTFVPGGACAGLTFDQATGVLSGTPVGLGTPTGDVCDFEFTLSNAAGSDTDDVIVTIFPGPIAPVARADTRQAGDGRSFFLDVLENDFLGHPRATITSHTFGAARGLSVLDCRSILCSVD